MQRKSWNNLEFHVPIPATYMVVIDANMLFVTIFQSYVIPQSFQEETYGPSLSNLSLWGAPDRSAHC
ncbi:hypothetical protein COCC4DRAFT_35182 [Bipolaris maydis ATCC 48331]|uniref:Uncharacterized protein n=2 Tax=Cochliobolus heterostrophus TaxID=5016 RepID=M2U9R9_COCH5|nr:uncharacterized protein COCC4DRAFT_35182 [Bipolaris maydis ATCC 48331]EMD84702.1 hypothetical protein COCHEDRAFT_1024883 [Bipolaris maydis C5]EMD84863.1 hypothetical protein COCHEDRAFT_1024773 [Bipolaris maydis C5]ENH98647.1 hypothetical protein COCC4DRAFT_35182 [Bipolaris maydis ATCC 48331]KAJ6214388.1 hypothetical protein PSV09DRAFT_1024883 [Bipolaris maydis]